MTTIPTMDQAQLDAMFERMPPEFKKALGNNANAAVSAMYGNMAKMLLGAATYSFKDFDTVQEIVSFLNERRMTITPYSIFNDFRTMKYILVYLDNGATNG